MNDMPRRPGRPRLNVEDHVEEAQVTTENVNANRPMAREDDPRARAAARAAALRSSPEYEREGHDEFHIDLGIIPDGWDYQWKVKAVLNKEDPQYMVRHANAGWEAVPASRHPELLPFGYSEQFVERSGMILMERPMEITQERRAREQRDARAQVSNRNRDNTQSGNGEFERNLSRSSQSYERMPVE